MDHTHYSTAQSRDIMIVMDPNMNTQQGYQQHQFYFNQQQQPCYPNMEFYYETPQHQQQQQQLPISSGVNNAAIIYQTPIPNNNDLSLLTSKPVKKPIDEDYVENLQNELQHTRQLLSQYQLRTEQLMELVTKQTDKIKELRSQIRK